MAYHLYNINTQQIIWTNNYPYMIDGKPGELPDYIVQLQDDVDAYPTNLESYQSAVSSQDIDMMNKKIHHRWTIIQKNVPEEIPLWAFRNSLILNNLFNNVQLLIDNLPEPDKTLANTHWEYGNFIVRDHPLIISLSSALGLTMEQVDDVFITGSLLS